MRKFEFNGKLPKKIDGVEIKFHKDENRCFAERIGNELPDNCINLPYFRRDAEFFFLRNKTQFIFYVPEYIERIRAEDVTRTASCWFGGRGDDGAFLTRLNDKPYKAYNYGDEKAFFDSLKPEVIKIAEKKFDAKCSERKGTFILPLPFTWEELNKVGVLFDIPKKLTDGKIFKEVTVFGNMKGHISNGTPGQRSKRSDKLYLLAGMNHEIENHE